MNAQKLAQLAFTTITVALVIATVYSANIYWGVYTAVRRLELRIQQFDIEITNASHAQVDINLTLKNPSAYVFTLRLIQGNLYLDSEYILASESNRVLQIAPQSSSELLVGAVVPEQKMRLVSESSGKMWFLYVNIILEGPLIGNFNLSNSTYLHA